MKLELKYLAPYLPYNVKCKMKLGPYFEEEISVIDSSNFWHIQNDHSASIKPILRPLSDLTKENYQNEILIRWGGGLSDRAKAQWLKEVTDDMLYSAYNSLRYDFVEFLLEHHFDVFGLIPQGLAIDINTLKQ